LQFVRLIANVNNPFNEDIITLIIKKVEKFGFDKTMFEAEVRKAQAIYQKNS